MSQAEDKVAAQMPLIQRALNKALEDAAGEPMAFVLMVVPVGRVGEHIVASNIIEDRTVIRFLRDAARTMKANMLRCQDHAAKMAGRAVN